ncbi:MAG: NYN domain-containing protein [Gemmatimonadaceae bacterium]
MHRGPQAAALNAAGTSPFHAPNAALLIDFDNVTMGIRSDLNAELRSLLSSDIVKGKVSVQRAYADWRRYPQYIVPLSESSIDLIFAPAYGSSKKNATDIRLAIDALELIFTRPEIGTFILLSGDSDFSSLVIKLKEYGKYVIGVGIRESSSDLLVQNCDEYYSYNALAGLVNTREEDVTKWDPWQLAGEAVQRMKRNGDVMRADRLKQVMQQIDSSFDEKNLGMSKFTRFVQEAAHRGIVTSHKMDNGQLEVDIPHAASGAPAVSSTSSTAGTTDDAAEPTDSAIAVPAASPREPRESRSRRGRGGRGRDRVRTEHADSVDGSEGHARTVTAEHAVAEMSPEAAASTESSADQAPQSRPTAAATDRDRQEPADARPVQRAQPTPQRAPQRTPDRTPERAPQAQEFVAPAPPAADASSTDGIGVGGMRLTRDEAFDLMRRAVDQIAAQGGGSRASDVRAAARGLLGRDSESLSVRNFERILKDAHDSDIIDLRRRGDDYEVRPAIVAAPIVDQLGAAAIANAPARPAAAPASRGMGLRGGGGRSPRRGGRAVELPVDLLSVGVVDYDAPVTPAAATHTTPTAAAPVQSPEPRLAAATPAAAVTPAALPAAPPAAAGKPSRGRKTPAKKTSAVAAKPPAVSRAAAKPIAKPVAKTAAKSARKKTATRK